MQCRMSSRIRFSDYRTASGQVWCDFKNCIIEFIDESIVFSQSLSRVLAGGDTIQENQISADND